MAEKGLLVDELKGIKRQVMSHHVATRQIQVAEVGNFLKNESVVIETVLIPVFKS